MRKRKRKQNGPQTCKQDPSWHLQVTQTQVMFVKRVFLRRPQTEKLQKFISMFEKELIILRGKWNNVS